MTVAGITKRFGNRRVLEDVSFYVYPSEVLGLIGPNRSGKQLYSNVSPVLTPANAGTVNSNGRSLKTLHCNEALFYLPDAIFPWSEQTVSW